MRRPIKAHLVNRSNRPVYRYKSVELSFWYRSVSGQTGPVYRYRTPVVWPVRSVNETRVVATTQLAIYSFHLQMMVLFHLGAMTKQKDFAYNLINYNSSISMLPIYIPVFFLENLLCTEIEQSSLLFLRSQLKQDNQKRII